MTTCKVRATEVVAGDYFHDGHCWAECLDTENQVACFHNTPVTLTNLFRRTYWKTHDLVWIASARTAWMRSGR